MSAEALSVVALAIAAIGGGSSLYAVVISRRALRWEEQRDRERTEPDVTISFGHATNFKPSYVVDLSSPAAREMYYELTVNVINSGEMTEFLKTLWVEPVGGGQGIDYSPSADIELRPHSRWPVPINAADVPASADGFVAIVHLAHGQKVVSPVEHLIEGLAEDAKQHNQRSGV